MIEKANEINFVYYLGEFDEKLELKRAGFSSSSIAFAKGLEVSEKFTDNNSDFLLEDTLKVPQGSKPKGSYYLLNDGNVEGMDISDYAYYPVDLKYNDKQVNVTHYLNETMYPGVLFAKAGNKIKFYCSLIDGYEYTDATYKAKSEKNKSSLAKEEEGNRTTYYFEMPEEPVGVEIGSQGVTISLQRTQADPVAMLNQEYTSENPLYDLTTVIIKKDAVDGEVEFAVDEQHPLPEGLKLEGNVICGTPTVSYTDGLDSVILVTGKNGSVVPFKLHVIVTEDPEQKQDSQEGRIEVNESTKTIDCYGNSIVIAQGTDDQTAIYLDDDADGKADYKQAAYEGDLSTYTIYGVKDMDLSKPVCITMTGGTVDSVIGAQSSNITLKDAAKEAVKVDLQGGKIKGSSTAATGRNIVGGVVLNQTKDV